MFVCVMSWFATLVVWECFFKEGGILSPFRFFYHNWLSFFHSVRWGMGMLCFGRGRIAVGGVLVLLSTTLLLSSNVSRTTIPRKKCFLSGGNIPLARRVRAGPDLGDGPVLPRGNTIRTTVRSLPRSSTAIVQVAIARSKVPTSTIIARDTKSIILSRCTVEYMRN